MVLYLLKNALGVSAVLLFLYEEMTIINKYCYQNFQLFKK